MDNKAIRRINLEVLRLETPEQTMVAVAERCRVDNPNLSEVKLGHRGMGDNLARRLEIGMGKPVGWMDVLHKGARNGHASPTPEEWKLLEAYRACPRETQDTIFTLCQQFAKK